LLQLKSTQKAAAAPLAMNGSAKAWAVAAAIAKAE